jgi:hypothetical protein
LRRPEEILVVANNVPVVRPVVNIAFPELNVVATAFVIVIFVALRSPEEILVVANNVPVVRPVVNIAFPEVKVVATAFVTFIFVALSIPEEILVVANNVAVVRPFVNIAFPELKVIVTAFVTVIFVAFNTPEDILVVANNVPVVRPVVNIPFPEVKVVATAFVTVLFIAFNTPELTLVVANNVAVVIFDSTILVDVIFTTVRYPATFKLPDKLILPPVIISVDNNVDETVPNEPIVEYNVLVEIFVAVIPVAISVPVLNVILTAFAIVLFVPNILPELIVAIFAVFAIFTFPKPVIRISSFDVVELVPA